MTESEDRKIFNANYTVIDTEKNGNWLPHIPHNGIVQVVSHENDRNGFDTAVFERLEEGIEIMDDPRNDLSPSIVSTEAPDGGLTLAPDKIWPQLIVRAGVPAQERFLEFFAATIRKKTPGQVNSRRLPVAMCDSDTSNSRTAPPCPMPPTRRCTTDEQETDSPFFLRRSSSTLPGSNALRLPGHRADRSIQSGCGRPGPRHSTKRGKTPVLTADEAKELIESIDTSTVIGLRDQALIAVMLYSFSRVSAVVGMRVADLFVVGRRNWIRLAEKGGKCHEVPVHHKAEEYLHAYLESAGIKEEGKVPAVEIHAGTQPATHGQGHEPR